MNLVTAIIRPNKLEDVREALEKVGDFGVTVSEVRGFGKQKGHIEAYGIECGFIPKVKLEIALRKSETKKVVQAISKAAKTGVVGDGKIFVVELKDAFRIRTEESGEAAL